MIIDFLWDEYMTYILRSIATRFKGDKTNKITIYGQQIQLAGASLQNVKTYAFIFYIFCNLTLYSALPKT